MERKAMNPRMLTVVSATVDAGRESELLAGFHSLVDAPVPDGLLRTQLLRGDGGHWQIQRLWMDRDPLTGCGPVPSLRPRQHSSEAWALTPRSKSSKSLSSTDSRSAALVGPPCLQRFRGS